jgi:hypothetical protein
MREPGWAERALNGQYALMRVVDAEDAFKAFVRGRAGDVAALSAADAINLMLGWYASERVDDVDIQHDGDMVLFQWGTWDWGAGPSFQYNVTRQLISVGAEDDDDIWQLSLTLHFQPTKEARAIGSGSRWCENPGQSEDLRLYIESSGATNLARRQPASRVELELLQAG